MCQTRDEWATDQMITQACIKGTVHPEIKRLSAFTFLMLLQSQITLIHVIENIKQNDNFSLSLSFVSS